MVETKLFKIHDQRHWKLVAIGLKNIFGGIQIPKMNEILYMLWRNVGSTDYVAS